MGVETLPMEEMEAALGRAEFVFNTVPARVISEPMLCMMADGAIVMELASPPGGFDRKLAENIGLRVLHAPGLPGAYAPESAAALIKETVYKVISEGEERL